MDRGYKKIRSDLFLNKDGFTLIELVIVIAIVAILTVGAMTILNPVHQFKKSRDADRKSDIKQIQVALEIYRSDQGGYPLGVNNAAGNCPDLAPTSLVELVDDACPTTPSTVFIQSLPKDPKTGLNYYYVYGSPSTSGYTIYSCLENAGDSEKLTSTSVPAIPSASIIAAMNCASIGTTSYYGVVNQ